MAIAVDSLRVARALNQRCGHRATCWLLRADGLNFERATMAKGIAWWVVLATLAATEARAADAE
ncbi:MAG: hypothetical protein RL846_01070, partial [Deltaproteobacteria bacterium]